MLASLSTIDTAGMSESTKALLWVIALMAGGGGGWIMGRKSKVQLDPNVVNVESTQCAQTRKSNDEDHDNLFLRVGNLEQRLSRLEATLPDVKRSMERLDDKVTQILLAVKTRGEE